MGGSSALLDVAAVVVCPSVVGVEVVDSSSVAAELAETWAAEEAHIAVSKNPPPRRAFVLADTLGYLTERTVGMYCCSERAEEIGVCRRSKLAVVVLPQHVAADRNGSSTQLVSGMESQSHTKE